MRAIVEYGQAPETSEAVAAEMYRYAAREGIEFSRIVDVILAETAGEIETAISCATGARRARDLAFMRDEYGRLRFLEAVERASEAPEPVAIAGRASSVAAGGSSFGTFGDGAARVAFKYTVAREKGVA